MARNDIGEKILRARVLAASRMPIDPETLLLRRLLAQQCRVMGARICRELGLIDGSASRKTRIDDLLDTPLSPRVRQTLDRLLEGDSEKQVAQRLKLSQHTVHVYVKLL